MITQEKFIVSQPVNDQFNMAYMFLWTVRVDYYVVQVHVHEHTNIVGKYMIHQGLIGSRGVAVPNLHNKASHSTIWRREQSPVNMGRFDTDLLIRIFTIK